MANPGAPEGVAPRVIALAGPTASGKTAAAMAVARQQPCEIISVDSALVYRGMDIGTAKPTLAEQAGVPHHLIDIRDPLQAYSAAEFAADARGLITQINARGKLALLVGGTMLYFKALFEGLNEMPPADAGVRAELEAEAAINGWPAMHAALARVDPATAARLGPNDSQRIQRALEVYRLTGKPLSTLHATENIAAQAQLVRPAAVFSLEPQERSWLHSRIAERFDAMLASGFLEEVKALRARGDLHADLPSTRCVGYRQAWELLDQQEANGGAFDMAQLRDKGIFATRQLARRQLTWLRGMQQREVIACDAPDAIAQLLARVEHMA
ncbi:MAG: tRNA (adenosine(37)-N6)-dimethylallyltransferase MiaA [Burkholderiales bacterium]|nr:tRNA (adenosine(37)-N6)-dimethylallyltransferase MiaA [Burkholderiales bacterium]